MAESFIDRMAKLLSGFFSGPTQPAGDIGGFNERSSVDDVIHAITDTAKRLQEQADRLAAEFRACFDRASQLKSDRSRAQRIAELKSDADAAAAQMRQYLREASEAYNDDRKADAKELSVIGRSYEAQARQLNQQVSSMFEEVTRASETGKKKQAECERLNEEVKKFRELFSDLDSELQRAKQEQRYALAKYDTHGRIVERMYRQGNLTWGYDRKGRVAGLDTHRGNETVHYNASFQVTGRSFWKGNVTEHFDLSGRLTGKTFHYDDRSEHFDASGRKTGTTYRRG